MWLALSHFAARRSRDMTLACAMVVAVAAQRWLPNPSTTYYAAGVFDFVSRCRAPHGISLPSGRHTHHTRATGVT